MFKNVFLSTTALALLILRPPRRLLTLTKIQLMLPMTGV